MMEYTDELPKLAAQENEVVIDGQNTPIKPMTVNKASELAILISDTIEGAEPHFNKVRDFVANFRKEGGKERTVEEYDSSEEIQELAHAEGLTHESFSAGPIFVPGPPPTNDQLLGFIVPILMREVPEQLQEAMAVVLLDAKLLAKAKQNGTAKQYIASQTAQIGLMSPDEFVDALAKLIPYVIDVFKDLLPKLVGAMTSLTSAGAEQNEDNSSSPSEADEWSPETSATSDSSSEAPSSTPSPSSTTAGPNETSS